MAFVQAFPTQNRSLLVQWNPTRGGHPGMLFLAWHRSLVRLLLLLLVMMFPVGLPQAIARDDKTDVVVMANGDHFIGEIKELAFGKLQFKAGYMAASVNLDWTKVKELESIRRFRVEFSDGVLGFGTIHKLDSPGLEADFDVVDSIGKTSRNFLEVVSLEPIEGSLWSRFRGTGDIGLTLKPEGGQTQWTANASLEYPAERFRVNLQANSLFSSQEGAEDSVRQSFGGAYYEFLSKKVFLLGGTQLLKDNQLDLSLRATFSGAVGHFLKHSRATGWAMFAGAASTYEKYFNTSPTNNAEALLGMDFYAFRFASSQVNSKLLIYPGISQWGRIRIDFDTSLSWEVWKDFYWKTSILENFDSRPPEGSPRNDFALTSSFGISF
jgi:uncharacterized protein DUF481